MMLIVIFNGVGYQLWGRWKIRWEVVEREKERDAFDGVSDRTEDLSGSEARFPADRVG
jgi:hypothetical protein